MERWLEKVRPGLGKYHTHLAGFGVEHVEDLAMLDDDMLEQLQTTLRAAGIPQLHVMMVVKATKIAADLPPARAQSPPREESNHSSSDDTDSDSSDEESETEGESEEEPVVLQPGPAKHDMLKVGRIIAIHDTRATLDGAEVIFDDVNKGKVLFEFKSLTGTAKHRAVLKKRWVFADACERLLPEGEVAAPETPTAFDEMQDAATDGNAFTHGLDPVGLAEHERERKRQRLKDAPVRGRQRAARKTPEPKLSVAKRLEDPAYMGTGLCNDGGQLWCAPCSKVMSMRKGTIDKHIFSPSHRKAHIVWLAQRSDDDVIKTLISNHFEATPDAIGRTLSMDIHTYRWRVIETFMNAGVSYTKIDHMRLLLEREGHTLTDSSHLAEMFIPLIHERELARLRGEIAGRHCSFIFDGTTRLGEATNFVARWVSDTFTIEQRLVRFITTAVHLNGDGLYRLFMTQIAPQLALDCATFIVGFSRDSCATNGVAVRHLQLLATKAVDMLCIPHTLHNMGKHCDLPMIAAFFTPWFQLVCNTHAAKQLWEEILGRTMSRFGKVRWWARWECWKEVSINFGAVPAFIQDLATKKIGEATTQTMLEIVEDEEKCRRLKLELATILSLERIVTATYRIEGDGLVLLLAYDMVEALRTYGANLGNDASDLPSVAALLRNEHTIAIGDAVHEFFGPPYNAWFTGVVERLPTPGSADYIVRYSDNTAVANSEMELRAVLDIRQQQEWMDMVEAVSAAFDYLESRLTGTCESQYDCTQTYEVCRVARLFDPYFALAHATPAYISELCAAVPSLAGHDALMKAELAAYRHACRAYTHPGTSDIPQYTAAVLAFWCAQGASLPGWASAAKKVFALTPTSAASERVFALLKSMFGSDQHHSLSDYIQAALMLRYNKRTVG